MREICKSGSEEGAHWGDPVALLTTYPISLVGWALAQQVRQLNLMLGQGPTYFNSQKLRTALSYQLLNQRVYAILLWKKRSLNR